MPLLRGTLLFALVLGTVSQLTDVPEGRDELLAGIIEAREKLEDLTEALRVYAMNSASGSAPSTERATTPPLPPTTAALAPAAVYNNCREYLEAGHTADGYYMITTPLSTLPFPVYCDMTTDGGGWLVFQRRLNGSELFYNRPYTEYARGFGDSLQADFWRVESLLTDIQQFTTTELREELEESVLSIYRRNIDISSETYSDKPTEFWMGNVVISALTRAGPTELRVEMTDWGDNEAYAKYSRFEVAGALEGYRLTLRGEYNGTAGDSLGYHRGSRFSTYDVDNDGSTALNCAANHRGGWWFKNCRRANLNGRYIRGGDQESATEGIVWSRFRGTGYSLKSTQMKIRPAA